MCCFIKSGSVFFFLKPGLEFASGAAMKALINWQDTRRYQGTIYDPVRQAAFPSFQVLILD